MTQPTGILLTNIGTPTAPTPTAVSHYLKRFLADRRVVELPRWLWLPILHGLILPLRAKRSAKLYQKIWTEHGSPLAHITQRQAQGLQTIIHQHNPNANATVVLGMSYSEPSIEQAMAQLQAAKVQKIIVLPLYPQYSAATAGACFDAVSSILQKWRYIPQLHFINHYADHPLYIQALVNQITQHRNTTTDGQKLLFSFHGIPKRCVVAGDPYFDQCHHTARLVAEKLGLAVHQWQVVFQSRFGKEEWLQPYCDKALQALPTVGINVIDLICPGFSADCLETLEEIAQTNHKLFIEAGGKKLHYIPALNDSEEHLKALANIVLPYL
jgi:ferrochelatase